MNIRITSWIASRYLRSRYSGRFAPLLTVTAIASIAVGTMALIVVMSVMRGFKSELADRLLGFNSHITLTKQADAAPLEREGVAKLLEGVDVRDVAPFVQGEVIAQSRASGELSAQGARVRGIDPVEMGAMAKINFYFPEGSEGVLELGEKRSAAKPPPAVIGSEIVGQLMVHPDFDDTLDLIAPLAEVGPSGDLIPNQMRFKVSGIFRAGIFDYDSKYILVSLDDARRLLGVQATEGWHIRLASATDTPAVLKKISVKLPAGWVASGVDSKSKKLFAALALERLAMGGILTMVLLIASCAIAGVVLLITSAKRKDVAILESIGMPARAIQSIFVQHAAFIGAAGSMIGLAAGLSLCLCLQRWPIRLPESYYLDTLPIDFDLFSSVAFASIGMLVAVFASIYPVHQAASEEPVEVLRYE